MDALDTLKHYIQTARKPSASGECEVPVPPRGTGTSLNVQRGKFSNRDNYSKADQPAVFHSSNTWFRVPSGCLGGQFRLRVPHTAVHAIATYIPFQKESTVVRAQRITSFGRVYGEKLECMNA